MMEYLIVGLIYANIWLLVEIFIKKWDGCEDWPFGLKLLSYFADIALWPMWVACDVGLLEFKVD